jgi:hypothetical protein
MAESLPRLCIFGDSHYACLKQAEVQGLVDVQGVELEYWGHVGGRFRYLEFRDGAIHPVDEFTARRFAKFNAKGRLHLSAADFDVVLVVGARIYVSRVFSGLLRSLCQGPLVSRGLQRRILTDWLREQAGYRLAEGLARTGMARILLSPVAYYTEESPALPSSVTPEIAAILPERVPEFWQILQDVAIEDGITLIRQPEETVISGLFTSEAYAVADHVRKRDHEHHNAAYGALILKRAMEIARQVPRRG